MKFYMPNFRNFFVASLSALALANAAGDKQTPPGDFYDEVSRLNKVLSEVNRKYVEDVNPTELTDAALGGIRNILDPHTTVFSPKDYESLKVSMEGKFGGVGITISLRDNILTVISPLSGTPAFRLGIRAGDRIRKIDGKDTKGLTLDDAVSKLRGKIGTDVTVSIEREGVPDLMDFTITRAEIIVHAVPHYGMVTKDIGYIKLATFSDKTTSDVENALRSLQKQGMKKVILDMRYNPGGLLNQAIEISELFLKQGNVIVSTRGRTQRTESRARKDGIIKQDIPMVVLVNQGSASAAEIVSGALQDWDRALIIGKTSFGKGSVQTIFPLDNQGNALKLTTAFYYLPFGRCINKPENGIKGLKLQEAEYDAEESGDEAKVDSLKKDTVAQDTFYTNNGRMMFGSGGITPDVEVELDPMPWVVQVQERMSMYFKFAVKARPDLEKSGAKISAEWEVPDSLYLQFKDYCMKDTNFTKIKSNALVGVDQLEKSIIREQNYMGDSSKTVTDSVLAARLAEMRTALENNRNAQFDENKDYIKDGIKRELLTSFINDSVSTAFSLKRDKQLNEAIKYLSDMSLYNKAIAPAKKQPAKKPTAEKAKDSKKK
ncbi:MULTISPECIES: S41 family peptidase [unclassified Fibrobacter]|nr:MULTISPECIES: S41 family peptidase [Fibrobacter]MCQ2099888.1 S41 family peptidase [Fibrobacter sp.]OWV02860.1 carboxyl-terminal protease [Fibrobacter sp. UWH3]OWV08827.1 carboxyl-terminal protease [Fibrobacter sp. UWH1]